MSLVVKIETKKVTRRTVYMGRGFGERPTKPALTSPTEVLEVTATLPNGEVHIFNVAHNIYQDQWLSLVRTALAEYVFAAEVSVELVEND